MNIELPHAAGKTQGKILFYMDIQDILLGKRGSFEAQENSLGRADI